MFQYLFPSGITNVNQLDFSSAVYIPINPSGVKGYMIYGKDGGILGWKCKKWSNGSNNSSTRHRKGRH